MPVFYNIQVKLTNDPRHPHEVICIDFSLMKKNIALESGSCGCISGSWTDRTCHGSGQSTTEIQRKEA